MEKLLILLGGQALSKVTSTGAMTYCFIQAIERGQATTYGNMLNAMRAAIRDADTSVGGGVVTTLLTMLLTGGSGVGLRQVFNFLHEFTSLSYFIELVPLHFTFLLGVPLLLVLFCL